jgi:hypothetical protein
MSILSLTVLCSSNVRIAGERNYGCASGSGDADNLVPNCRYTSAEP